MVQYNAFGEIVLEQLAGQEDVIYDRDQLGRATSVRQGTSTTLYQFDSAAYGVGKPDLQQSASGVTTAFTYRPNGLPESTTWFVENAQFRFDWEYSSARLVGVNYPDIGGPQRFRVGIGYASDGQVGNLYASNPVTLLWRKSAVADDGRVYREEFGNGLSTIRNIDSVSGKLRHISTGSGSVVQDADGGDTFANRLQSLGYVYFENGKLQTRSDFVLGNVEGFDYDNVDRVKSWTPSRIGPQPQTGTVVEYGYDDTGNLKSRNESSSAGISNETYHYGENGAGPHALTSGPLGSYTYDASGRQASRPGQPLLAYTMFDLPTQIQRADGSAIDFAYDADGGRVVKKTATSSVISLASLYERRTDSNGTTHVFSLPGNGRVVGQIVCATGGSCEAPVFFHPDRYGTIDTTTGSVVGHEKRDPFGRPYTIGDSGEPGGSVTVGFTGGEEDDETGLVNLQHRLYDPRVGRFISPDPLVKDPFGGQHYNRYAYASNNPLSFVDPSGLLSEPPPEGDLTGPPPPFVDMLDTTRITIGETGKTNGSDGKVTHYVRGNDQIPSAPPRAGDPPAPYRGLNSTSQLPRAPTFSAPPSPSQDHVNSTEPQSPDSNSGGDIWGGPNVGNVPPDRVFAENGRYLGPPGGLWGDTAPRDGLGIIGPNGEKARDTSTDWLFMPYKTFAAVTGVAGVFGLGRMALGTGVRVFWNGGRSYAGSAAQRWAAANGAKILEDTLVGRVLEVGKSVFGFKLMSPFFRFASSRFAATASGDVHLFFVGESGVSLGSYFLRYELPALMQNPAVVNIGLHFLPP